MKFTAILRFIFPCLLLGLFLLESFPSYSQYKGGSYDGVGQNSMNCPPRPPLPDTGKVAYKGGSHDGFSVAIISCQVVTAAMLTDVYTGGSHDGYATGSVSCPVTGQSTLTNVFKGGSHDGFGITAVSCPPTTGQGSLTNIYTGGSHDGFTNAIISCPGAGAPAPLTDIYTGGSHDGYAQLATSCPPRPPLPDTGKVAYKGGAHGGFAMASVSCQATGSTTLTNIFKGASHDGFGITSVSCLVAGATTLTNIFKGNFHDGFASADVSCPVVTGPGTLTNIFSGASYDGFSMAHISCPTEPLFADSISSQNLLCGGQCNGTATSFPSNGTGPYTYYWNTTPPQTTQTATGLCSGTYSVTVTDAIYNTATATRTITQPIPLTDTVITTNSTCGLSNGLATANPAGGKTPYTYLWNTTPAQTTKQATGIPAGTYNVIVSDSSHCSITTTAIIGNTGLPLPDTVSISTSLRIVCFGATETFTAITTNGGSNPAYQWKLNGANVGTNSDTYSTDSLHNNDVVTCVVASNANCVIGSPDTSNAITVTVHPSPQVSATSHNDTLFSSHASTYQWYFNNVLIPGANSDIYVAHQVGNYSVEITDSIGCTARSNNVYILAVSIADLWDDNHLEIYPNPASGSFNIIYSGTANRTYHLNIFDMVGEKVNQVILNLSYGKTTPVNISQLSKGVYLLQFQTEHHTTMRKIVVE